MQCKNWAKIFCIYFETWLRIHLLHDTYCRRAIFWREDFKFTAINSCSSSIWNVYNLMLQVILLSKMIGTTALHCSTILHSRLILSHFEHNLITHECVQNYLICGEQLNWIDVATMLLSVPLWNFKLWIYCMVWNHATLWLQKYMFSSYTGILWFWALLKSSFSLFRIVNKHNLFWTGFGFHRNIKR